MYLIQEGTSNKEFGEGNGYDQLFYWSLVGGVYM